GSFNGGLLIIRAFHAMAGSDFSRYENAGSLSFGRKQNAQITVPRPSIVAPTATCVVATSAALLLQIVQAPRASCTTMPMSQAVERPRNGEIFPRCAERKN